MKKRNVISIIAGGWSVSKVDTSRLPGFVIGVNDASLFINGRVDAALTMDRLWAEHRYDWLTHHHAPKPFYVRRSARKNLPLELPPWVNVFENDNNSVIFSDEEGVLHGTNSGFCALNLAYQMCPDQLFLFGFDMNRSPLGRPYWFPDYPWAKAGGATTGGKYQAWAKQFKDAADAFKLAKIEVLNVSLTSAIDVFPKVDPSEVML